MIGLPRLRVHGVSKAFPYDGGSLLTLDGVSFDVAPEEFVAIIGPSGCGKSTLLEIICGLQSADAGWIEIDGRRAESPGKQVAYMPQADLLFPWRRTLDNIILPQIVQGVPKKEAEAKARKWLPLFGLEDFERAYPGQLSGGMRQRLRSCGPSSPSATLWPSTNLSALWTPKPAAGCRSGSRVSTASWAVPSCS